MNIFRKTLLISCVVSLLVSVSCFSVSSEVFTNGEDNIAEIMKQLGIPSISAGIIKNNSIVWYKGYGCYDKFFRKKTTIYTNYLAASTSKAVTATALMQLYEKGKFDLDDDVNEYLPFSLRNPNHPDEPITFRMLLSHQSSLSEPGLKELIIGNIAYMFKCFEKYLVPGERRYDPSAWATDHPGEAFNYSNLGFGILGYLVEILSGESFNEYCKAHIFEPLKMYSTSFKLRDLKRRNIAVPYIGGKRILLRLPRYAVPISPAGGLITSVEELSHFLIAHMNGGIYQGVQILNESSVDLMHTAHTYGNISGFEFYYGLGWMIMNNTGTIYQGHPGGTIGSHCHMKYRESDKTGIIFFDNYYTLDMEKAKLLGQAHNFISKELFKIADGL